MPCFSALSSHILCYISVLIFFRKVPVNLAGLVLLPAHFLRFVLGLDLKQATLLVPFFSRIREAFFLLPEKKIDSVYSFLWW